MSNFLSAIAAILKSRMVPDAVAYHVWKSICARRSGEPFYFRQKVNGKKSAIYGGVCGFTDQALFGSLDRFEEETVGRVRDLLASSGGHGDCGGPVILDVGANNGQWLILLKMMDPAAKIHCFEPFRELIDFISTLIVRNGFQEVWANQMFVGNTGGVGALHFETGTTDTASTVGGLRASFNSSREISQTTIDAYVRENHLERVDLIR